MAPGAITTTSAAGAGAGDVAPTTRKPPTTTSAAAALEAAMARFAARNPRSRELHERALASMPGGNTRAQLHTPPFPVAMRRGAGHAVTSEDGHDYVDLVGELTAGLLGHSHPAVRRAVEHVLDRVGLSLGATVAQEHALAAAVCARFALARVRFCNSGTEANLYALAAARAFTGRRRVVAFSAGYHGGVLAFEKGKPGPGVVDRDDWIVAEFNDAESAREAISQEGVAAVLVEGMQGSAGAIPGTQEFLKTIEATANEVSTLARYMHDVSRAVSRQALTTTCLAWCSIHLGRGDDVPTGPRRAGRAVPTETRHEDHGQVARGWPRVWCVRRKSRHHVCLRPSTGSNASDARGAPRNL